MGVVGTRLSCAGILMVLVTCSGICAAADSLKHEEDSFFGLPIADVVIEASPGEDKEVLRVLTGLDQGQQFSADLVRQAVKRLYQLDRFENVFVRARRQGDEGVAIELVLPPRLRVRSVAVLRSEVLDEAEVEEVLALEEGAEFDRRELPAIRLKLREALSRMGYPDAAVGLAVERADRDGGMKLLVRIEEGPQLRMRKLVLAGTPERPRWWIEERISIDKGDLIDMARIEAGVTELLAGYRKLGHVDAVVAKPQVRRLRKDGLALPAADLMLSVNAGPKVDIHFSGNLSISSSELKEDAKTIAQLGSGDAAVNDVTERIRARYEKRGFWKVSVRARSRTSRDNGKKDIVFGIREGLRPRVATLRFPGNTHFAEGALRRLVYESLEYSLQAELDRPGADPEVVSAIFGDESVGKGRDSVQPYNTPPDPERRSPFFQDRRVLIYVAQAYRGAVEEIADRYRTAGYQTVVVQSPRIVPRKDFESLVDIEIEVFEGIQWTVASLSFEGNRHVAGSELVKVAGIRASEERIEPLTYAAVEEAKRSILEYYRNRGYLYASAQEVLLEYPPPSELKGIVRRSSMRDIRQHCSESEEAKQTRCKIELRFRIEEGPRVRARQVVLKGIKYTNRTLVRDEILVRPGDFLNASDMAESRSNLLRLGVFERVTVTPFDEDRIASEKDLLVEVKERKHLSFEVGAGASTEQGLRIFSDFGHANLFGRAIRLQATAKLSYLPQPFFVFLNEELRSSVETFYDSFSLLNRLERELAVGLNFSRVFGLPAGYSAGVNVSLVRDNDPDFALDSRKVTLTGNYKGFRPGVLGRPRPLTLQLRAELDWSDLSCNALTIRGDVPQRLDAQCAGDDDQGSNIYIGLGPRVSWDFRDRPLDPRKGFYFEIGTQYAKGLDASSADYVDVEGQLNVYLPLSKGGAGFAAAVIVHRTIQIDELSLSIPRNRRAFVGGQSTVRGYAERSIFPRDGPRLDEGDALSPGGELAVALKTELRIPLFGALSLAGFLDIGELFQDAGAFEIGKGHAVGAGAGLRYATPVGPLSIDFAVPLNRSRGVPQFLNFSVRSF